MCDVNIATGEVTQFEFDILLPGRIPWQLTRRYSSENPQLGAIGFGWKPSLGTFLARKADQLEMVVDGESFAQLPYPAIGTSRLVDDAGVTVARTEAGISVTDRSRMTFVFPCGERLPDVIPCSTQYDHYGNALQFLHDEAGRIQQLIDSFNRQIFFAYDLRSRLTDIYVRSGDSRFGRLSLIRYQYDSQDDLVAVLDGNENATRYEYSAHLLTHVTDPGGRDLYYQYNHEKQCVRTWFTGGVWDRQLSYDRDRQRVLVTDPHGYSTVYKHNGKGTVVGDVDPLGRVREDVLDQNGQLLLRAGPGGGMPSVMRRDPGSATVRLSRNGMEIITEVNANDQVTSLKNQEGKVWKWEYDPAGNETGSEAPDGAVWKFDYDEHGDLVRSVDPVGYERQRQQSADRLTLRDQWGLRLDERSDYFGRPIVIADGEGGEVRFDYDGAGNPVRRVNPDGTAASVEYDAAGRPALFTDELGDKWRVQRDATESSLRTIRPDGKGEAFEYGLTDELKRIVNANEETAEFTYDAAGRCTSVTYFDGRQHAIAYDDADNPLVLFDGHTGKVLAECTYSDDALVQESYFDGRRLTIEYGPAGEVISAQNDDARLAFERDPLMRVVMAQANALELSYAYNLRGDLTSLTTKTGRRIEYQWDGRGRLVQMVDTSSGTYEYSYDARDLVVEIRMPNGCVQHFTYDRRQRMTSRRVTRADGALVCSRDFSYDGASRLIAFEDSARGARRFAYDAMDSLTAISDNGGIVRFQYDANGNLLTTRTGTPVTYAPGDRPERVGGDQLAYDERGNLVEWSSQTGQSRFEYTGEGWLKRAVLADGTAAEYEYDPMARRTAKTVNGRRTEFDWNGVHLLSERTDGRNVDYLFMPGSFFATGLTVEGRHYSYVCDQLGTPTELLDDAGEIVWAADYGPHGEITALLVGQVSQPLRFLGQYYDEELGWHYNRFRYYHPHLGLFTSPDPLCFAAGINLYRYAPNPVNWVDPVGLSFATPAAGRTPATCEVMSKCDWGPKMMEEAKKKTEGVNEKGCKAIVTGPCDRPPDQKDFLMANCVDEEDKAKVEKSLKTQNDSCKSKQVDHIQEVQCGGTNKCNNLAPLTQTVNGSFGSQIKQCRDQLAAAGVTGTVKMVIKLVNIRSASAASLKNHGKEPCDSKKTRCP